MRKSEEPLDPTDLQVHAGQEIMPVNDVLSRLEIRSKAYENLDVDKVSDLNIHWSDQDNEHRTSGWYAKIGNRDLMLSEQAIRGASKMVKVSDIKYWNQFPDRNAFPTTLAHILEHAAMSGNRQNAKRLLVRHDGINVRAIQPFVYKIKDAYELVADFVQMLAENVGEIHGISSVEDGDPGDICSYRVVVGQNIMPMLKDEYGQYMMWLIACSETGAIVCPGATAATAMGVYRTSCLNSAIREKLITKWNHRSKGLEKFYNESADRIRMMGYYRDQYADIFKELLSYKLVDVAPRDLLAAFESEKLITSGHYDAAEMYIDMPTEDGRPVETQYDLFNVLTKSAQELPSLAQRQAAETRALHLFTEKGGIFERLRTAAQERAKERALRKGGNLENVDDSTYSDGPAEA